MSNVAGTWTVTTDFGCDGSIAGSFNQTFNADGTWTNTIGSNGRWYQVEGLVVWDFNNAAKLVYAANLAGSWMSGSLGLYNPRRTERMLWGAQGRSTRTRNQGARSETYPS